MSISALEPGLVLKTKNMRVKIKRNAILLKQAKKSTFFSDDTDFNDMPCKIKSERWDIRAVMPPALYPKKFIIMIPKATLITAAVMDEVVIFSGFS